MTARTRSTLVAVVLAAFVAMLAVCRAAPGEMPSVYRYESGGLVFTYHTPTNTESLFDTAADPRMLRNLARERPADLVRLRDEFLKKNGIESVEELRHPQQDLIDRLRHNGYF